MIDSVLTLLKKAREIISDPSRWTQRSYARTTDSIICSIDHEYAFSWCSAGAIYHCAVSIAWSNRIRSHLTGMAYDELQRTCRDIEPLHNLIAFNDNHSHSEVLAMWDKTIQRLENGYAV